MKKCILIICLLFFMPVKSVLIAQDLLPGDGVRVIFFNISDEISGDYFVQKDGRIHLPYIGLITVSKREFPKVQAEIISKYDSLYKQPELTVQPLFRISIFGEVQKPGIYFATGFETLTDMIAEAGGETSDANLDDISIIRENEEIQVDATEIIKKGKKVSDIGLKSGDQIYVPRKWLGGARNTAVIISGIAVVVTLISILTRK